MLRLRRNIYVESGFHGVTVGAVVTSKGIICIDTPTLPADARKWRLRLEQLEADDIFFIINTDHNRDRVVGNQWFDAPVIAHEQTYELMAGYSEVFKSQSFESGGDHELAKDLIGVRTILPQVSYSDEIQLVVGGRTIELLHKSGATSGTTWVRFPEARVIFTGDTVFQNTHPFLNDAQIDLWLENLAELRRAVYKGWIIVPGRDRPIDQTQLDYCIDYLRYLRRRLASLHRRGKPCSDALKIAPALLERYPPRRDQYSLMKHRLEASLEEACDALEVD